VLLVLLVLMLVIVLLLPSDSVLTSARPLGPNTTRATTATRMASGAPTPRKERMIVCSSTAVGVSVT
jgi:hypothetical protein